MTKKIITSFIISVLVALFGGIGIGRYSMKFTGGILASKDTPPTLEEINKFCPKLASEGFSTGEGGFTKTDGYMEGNKYKMAVSYKFHNSQMKGPEIDMDSPLIFARSEKGWNYIGADDCIVPR